MSLKRGPKTEALTLVDKNLGIGPRKIYGGKLRLSRQAKCIRNTSNWSKVKLKYRFDNKQFDKKEVKKVLPEASPKIYQLIKNITELDQKDLRESGNKFKHFIFSDIRGLNGIKIVASSLISHGFELAMKPGKTSVELSIKKPKRERKGSLEQKSSISLIDTDIAKNLGKDNKFVLLTATGLWGKPITEKLKKEVIKVYNKRPSNIHGRDLRIIVGDSGYKEGVDLFDVKYVHILEPQLSEADFRQAVGRATRLCGQSGLEFVPNKGWTLNVFEYHLNLPKELTDTKKGRFSLKRKSPKLPYKTSHEMMLDIGKVDVAQTKSISEMQNLLFQTAVDRDLNLAINFFGKPESTFEKFQRNFEEITGRVPPGMPIKRKSGSKRKKTSKNTSKKSDKIKSDKNSSKKRKSAKRKN